MNNVEGTPTNLSSGECLMIQDAIAWDLGASSYDVDVNPTAVLLGSYGGSCVITASWTFNGGHLNYKALILLSPHEVTILIDGR